MPDQPPIKHPGNLLRFAVNAACFTAPPILLNIINVPVMAYLIRGLGDSNYGRWMTAVALVNATAFLTSLGLRPRFIRALAQTPDQAQSLAAAQFGTRLILTALAASLSLLACLALRYPVKILECVAIGGSAVVLNSVVTTATDALQAFEKFPALAVSSFTSGLLLTAASVLAIWRGGGPASVAASYLVGPLVSSTILLLLLLRRGIVFKIHLSLRNSFHLIWSSRYLGFQQMLFMANANVASLTLPKLIGPADFGLYASGAMILDRLAIIPDSVGTALYPMVAKSSHTNMRLAARRAFAGLGFALLICLLVAATNSLLSHWIATILFPNRVMGCERVIRITSWALPLIAIENTMGYALLAAGREASQSRASLRGVLIALAAGLPAIFHFGLNGAFCFIIARPAIMILCRLSDYWRTFILRIPSTQPAGANEVDLVRAREAAAQTELPTTAPPLVTPTP